MPELSWELTLNYIQLELDNSHGHFLDSRMIVGLLCNVRWDIGILYQ